MKPATKNIFTIVCSLAFILVAQAQTNQGDSKEAKHFKELLSQVNASFATPDGFTEIKALNSEKTNYQYALEIPDGGFEVRFQVNDIRKQWKLFDKGSAGTNPDSLYTKIVDAQVSSLSAEGNHYHNVIPPRILQYYNADLGHSYYFGLMNAPYTKGYQYALLVVIQKSRYGSISVICLGNERGPEFFKKVNKLRSCIKFEP